MGICLEDKQFGLEHVDPPSLDFSMHNHGW